MVNYDQKLIELLKRKIFSKNSSDMYGIFCEDELVVLGHTRIYKNEGAAKRKILEEIISLWRCKDSPRASLFQGMDSRMIDWDSIAPIFSTNGIDIENKDRAKMFRDFLLKNKILQIKPL